MLEVRRRVGREGEVVVPEVVRNALTIGAGRELTIAVEGEDVVFRVSRTDVVDVFERIAKSGKSIGAFPSHAAYTGEHRTRRA